MLIVKKNMEFIEYISRGLEKFDMIFLFLGSKNERLLKAFCESDMLREIDKKILILSTVNIEDNFYGLYEYRRISEEEQGFLEQLYRMYDFSNRFQIISDDPQYGGLLNYVKTGIMTIEEVFQVLLR